MFGFILSAGETREAVPTPDGSAHGGMGVWVKSGDRSGVVLEQLEKPYLNFQQFHVGAVHA